MPRKPQGQNQEISEYDQRMLHRIGRIAQALELIALVMARPKEDPATAAKLNALADLIDADTARWKDAVADNQPPT